MQNAASAAPATKVRIDRELLKALAKPAPGRLLIQTGIEWVCIIVLIVIANRFSNIAVSIGCMLFIATRQHALLALMHEYSHYQLSRRRPWLNDLLGDVLTAFPFFITIHGFRRNHMLHHRHVWTEHDPNWLSSSKKARYQFPKTRRQVFAEIVKHCIGWYTLEDLKGYTVNSGMALDLPRSTHIHRAVFAVFLAAVVTYFGMWWTVLLYWIVPLSTFLMAILYLRDLGEHFGTPMTGFASSRTVLAGWLERTLISQNGVNFHTEHHLYPSMPFFRLNSLHQALMKDRDYRDNAVITRGYLAGLIVELSAAPVSRQGIEKGAYSARI